MTMSERPAQGLRESRVPVFSPPVSVPRQADPRDPAGTGSYTLISEVVAIATTVSVIIPAWNEAENLPHVFASLPGWLHEVVLVDGRSTDDTVAVARRLLPGVKIVTQVGSGKGDALLAGFAASTGDIIVAMDADGSTDGREITRFVAALVAGADYVKGSRFASGGGSDDLTWMRSVGNRFLGALVNRLFGTRYTDLCYGFNAFWACHLETLALDCPGFEIETVMNIRAGEAGLRVHEVPSFEHQRVHGASNLHIVVDGWRIAQVIVREWRSHRRSGQATSPALAPDLTFSDAIGQGMSAVASPAVASTVECVELT
jgi:glycosyltransferase involved in cell wall biosynthesis